jgi:hypothetical protein
MVSLLRCRCHGRLSDGDNRSFPGLGSVPVLVVPGSSMEAKFRSDSSSNDWGYKFSGLRALPPQLITSF